MKKITRSVSTASLVRTFANRPCYHGQFSGVAFIRNGRVSPISQVCGDYMQGSTERLGNRVVVNLKRSKNVKCEPGMIAKLYGDNDFGNALESFLDSLRVLAAGKVNLSPLEYEQHLLVARADYALLSVMEQVKPSGIFGQTLELLKTKYPELTR